METIPANNEMIIGEIRNLISQGLTVSINVRGNSMNPFLVDMRDQITLGPWKDGDIRKGCVALVMDDRGNYLIHRIIRREGDIIFLLGDGNLKQQERATLDNIIGIMHSVSRKGRIYISRDLTWRMYSCIWMLLAPVRRLPLGLWRRLFL